MNIRPTIIIIACLTLAACSTIQVKNDYDPGYDFTKLRTFDWIPNPNVQMRSELVVKHFKKMMTEHLSSLGIAHNERDPDFLIAYHGNVEKRININGWGYRYPLGYGGFDVYHYHEGNIVVDFIDANSKDLIYRSSLTTEVDRRTDFERRQKKIKEAVEKIMKDFPLKPK